MLMYQNGNEQAFRVLYERHSAKVYGYVRSKIKSTERTNDIFQEIFVKIHRSKHLYNQSLPFLPWLFTVSRNAIVDHVRQSKHEQSQVEFEDHFSAPVVEEKFEMKELTPHIQALPANQRRAIELRYNEEKTFEEIAVILETSSSNARQLISRGIDRIREIFKDGEK